jgi:hypothetical protein
VADVTLNEGDEVHAGALYRRIYPHRDYFKDDRPTSMNFLPPSKPPAKKDLLSFHRAAEVAPSDMLDGHENFGLLEIDAERLWAIGKRVIYTPSKGKGHCDVHGFNKKDGQSRRDAAFASRVVAAPTIAAATS